MKLKVILSILFFLQLFSPALFASSFYCWTKTPERTQTTLSIPRPPDVLIPRRNVRVVVAETPKTLNAEDTSLIRRAVELALVAESGTVAKIAHMPDFIIDNDNPSVTFKIYVVNFDLSVNRPKLTEERRVVVGQDCTTNSSGNRVCTDRYGDRNVSVEYWEAQASTSWRIEVEDSSGTLIDSGFNPRGTFSEKRELSVNGVSPNNQKPLLSESQIKSQLYIRAVSSFFPRYRTTYDIFREVDLACNNEFTAANKLVENSTNSAKRDWEGALKLWELVVPGKNNESGKVYGMAVAYEALAFRAYETSGDPKNADPYFDKALELYNQAMTMDPKEKYIQQAAQRLTTSKNNLKKIKEQKEILDREERFIQELTQAENEARERAEEERQRTIKVREEVRQNRLARPEEDDTPEEKVFRTYIRARIGNLDVIDDDEVISAAQGKFKLNEEQALRVFDQEIERLEQEVAREAERVEKIRIYQEDFEIFVMDGVIDKNERDVLNAIAGSLSMTAEEIKTAESDYVFTDESASPTAKKSTPSK